MRISRTACLSACLPLRKIRKMPLLPTDETRICPYDPTHEILVTRWERHLLRCRPQHLHLNLQICRFNWQHHVPAEELAYHERECAREEMNQGNSTPFADPTFVVPDPMRNHKAGLVTEVDPEWEQEVAPYDPKAVAMSKPVIRLFQNMPKRAKREAREKDRIRIRALQDAEKNKEIAEDGKPNSEKTTPRTLRQPGDEETQGTGNDLAGNMSNLEISNANASRFTTTGESAYDKYLRICDESKK